MAVNAVVYLTACGAPLTLYHPPAQYLPGNIGKQHVLASLIPICAILGSAGQTVPAGIAALPSR